MYQDKSDMSKVIGIMMTYNCAHLVEATYKALPGGTFDQIIIVDDGSKDESQVVEIAKKLNVLCFTHPHSGYGGNLRYGLQKSVELGGEFLVEVHGDGQFDQSHVGAAVEKMQRENLDFLIGSRFTNLRQPLIDGMPIVRYLANIGLSFIERIFLGIPWSEYHPGFRVYRRRFIENIDLSNGANDYVYSFQIIALAAYKKARCGEIPVRANYHREHTSVGYWRATKNSFQEMGVLFLYIGAKMGFKTKLFS
jgi:glycosyltransferase involved in cell wall biosynthesis